MFISKKRFASLGAAALITGTGIIAATGTASAATCTYSEKRDALVSIGSSHAGIGTGDCGWLYPGRGIEGHHGKDNAISLGNIPLGGSEWLVGFINDPTGLLPVNGGNGGDWIY